MATVNTKLLALRGLGGNPREIALHGLTVFTGTFIVASPYIHRLAAMKNLNTSKVVYKNKSGTEIFRINTEGKIVKW